MSEREGRSLSHRSLAAEQRAVMAGVNDGICKSIRCSRPCIVLHTLTIPLCLLFGHTVKTWCKNDFSTISLQRPDPVYTHSHTNRLTHSVPVTRGETSALARSSASWQPAPAKPAVQSVPIAPARITTDNISHWTAPSTVTSHGPELHKFNVLSRSEPWTPHPSNVPGARRAVYDPIAHKTTVFTFDGKDGISRVEVRLGHAYVGLACIAAVSTFRTLIMIPRLVGLQLKCVLPHRAKAIIY